MILHLQDPFSLRNFLNSLGTVTSSRRPLLVRGLQNMIVRQFESSIPHYVSREWILLLHFRTAVYTAAELQDCSGYCCCTSGLQWILQLQFRTAVDTAAALQDCSGYRCCTSGLQCTVCQLKSIVLSIKQQTGDSRDFDHTNPFPFPSNRTSS